MNKLTKCVNCGSSLVFSPEKNMVVCEYCNSMYPVPIPKREIKILRQYTPDYAPQPDAGVQNLFVCGSCNTTHAVADGKVSVRCPSCGDTNISRADEKAIFPDGIIPFTLNKDKAITIFEKWLKKRKFAPSDLFKLCRNGKLSKVYVPIFNLNATSISAYNAMVKKVHTDSDTNTIYSTMHTVQDVSSRDICDQALCANNVLDCDLIEKIVSIDQEKIVPYSTEYLLGYYGTQTNVSLHDLLDNVEDRLKKEAEKKIRSKLKDKYDEIVHLNCNTQLKNITFNYVYAPVFINHFKYKNKAYYCYISGTTGKVAGIAPKSAIKILALVGSIFLAIGLAALVLLKII